MTKIAAMIAGSLAGALLAIGLVGRAYADEVLFGMLGPLAAVVGTWTLVEWTRRRDPARLTGLLMAAFVVKMVFFGLYVALVLRAPGLDTVPFAASFAAYFIVLYAVEAVLIGRLPAAVSR